MGLMLVLPNHVVILASQQMEVVRHDQSCRKQKGVCLSLCLKGEIRQIVALHFEPIPLQHIICNHAIDVLYRQDKMIQ